MSKEKDTISTVNPDTFRTSVSPNESDVITFGSLGELDTARDTLIGDWNSYSDSNQDYWEDDGISFVGNPYTSPDTMSFNINMSNSSENKNGFWKYNEDKILKQLEQYITGTYNQHYVDETGGVKQQTLDKIKHNRREGFCAGNVTKYIDRYDTKGTPRQDLFKVLHYTILLINHLNLIENK